MTPNAELEALREALAALGFERVDYFNPAAPIAIKRFADGDLEVYVGFQKQNRIEAEAVSRFESGASPLPPNDRSGSG